MPAGLRPVVVVGGGPAGLSAALMLRAEGVPVTLLDDGPVDRRPIGSRAIFVHRQSLELLEQARAGVGTSIAGAGLAWLTKRSYWAGRQVYERTYPPAPADRLPHATNLAQTVTERLLVEACGEAGVELAWGREVATVTTSPDGATLRTTGGEEWSASYVVAADGARSTLRRRLGVDMQGTRSANAFVVVDVAVDPDATAPPERVFHYRHPAVGGRNVLLVPFAGGLRVDLQCRPDDDPDDFADPERARDWVAAAAPGATGQITWTSSYRFLQTVADAFTDDHRRVLLVGEAAHLFAPFGARGMNSGIADAAAAARAIRVALESPDQAAAAVDGFVADRRAAALRNRDAAGQALSAMQANGVLARLKQGSAAAVARAGRRAGAWLDSAPYGPRAGRSGESSNIY